MDSIWELMKLGPTSANLLPARIVWRKSQEAKDKLASVATEENVGPIRKAPATAIIAMDMIFFEQGPKLFLLADVRSWFDGPEAQAHEAAFRNSTLQAPTSSSPPAPWGSIAARCPVSTLPRSTNCSSPGTTYRSNFLSTVGHGDPASLHYGCQPRPPFD